MIRLIDEHKDLTKVCEIEDLCFVNGHYNKEQIIYEIHNELSKFFVYEEDDKILGFIIFMVTFNSATVVQLATHPKFQRKGIATKLFNEMITYLNGLGYGVIETVTLEVRENNETAHKFYLKNKFKDTLLKNKYYTNGDNAIYMTRILL